MRTNWCKKRQKRAKAEQKTAKAKQNRAKARPKHPQKMITFDYCKLLLVTISYQEQKKAKGRKSGVGFLTMWVLGF